MSKMEEQKNIKTFPPPGQKLPNHNSLYAQLDYANLSRKNFVIEWHMLDKNKFFPLSMASSFCIRSCLHPLIVVKTRLQVSELVVYIQNKCSIMLWKIVFQNHNNLLITFISLISIKLFMITCLYDVN